MAQVQQTPLFTDANLKAYWRFEGNSNDGKATHNGTDTSMSYSSTQTKYGQSASFNGTSSFISIPSSTDFHPASYSLVLWINPSSITGTVRILARDTTSNRCFDLHRISAKLGWSNWSDNTNQYNIQLDNNCLTVGTWTHVAVVNNAGTFTFYVNGVSQAYTVSGSYAALNASTNAVNIGRREFPTFEDYYSGYVDDAAWFSRALTAAEVRSLVAPEFQGGMI